MKSNTSKTLTKDLRVTIKRIETALMKPIQDQL